MKSDLSTFFVGYFTKELHLYIERMKSKKTI